MQTKYATKHFTLKTLDKIFDILIKKLNIARGFNVKV